MDIFIDCETAPTDAQWFIDEIDITPPGNYKKPESIKKWMDENAAAERQSVIDKTAVDTSLAQIICIGYAVGNDPIQTLTGSESDILVEFFTELQAYRHIRLVGHNIVAFDIPLIFHRAIINDIRPHWAFHMDYKPWDVRCFDTMIQWAGTRDLISQHRLAQLLGLPTQKETGADVLDLYKAGDMEGVQRKCAFDVEQNRAIFNRILGL